MGERGGVRGCEQGGVMCDHVAVLGDVSKVVQVLGI